VIALSFEGVRPVITQEGSLMLKTSVNTVTEQPPYAYQLIGGREIARPCRYRILPGNRIGFAFPEGYDKLYPLVIDPVLVFSTFSGSTATTFGFSATYDHQGSLYAGGECFNIGWPVTTGAYQATYGGTVDAGINKYSSDGDSLLYSTYYGGLGSDLPNNMIVNAAGELVICGSTTSLNLPVPAGCYDNTYNGGSSDLYIARFSADGSQLRAATYIGGSGADGSNSAALSSNMGDMHRGEVLTSAGSIYIAGSSSSPGFPVTSGALQPVIGGLQDGVVCKFDTSLTVLQYSTFIGGSEDDAAFSLVLNGNGEVVICGGTKSNNFPVTPGAFHTTHQGGADGFAAVISTATGLVHSTYLGTASFDHGYKVQVDSSDNILVMGQTTGAYPVSAGVYSIGNGDIFIDKLNPALSASLLSTRLGNPQLSQRFIPTAFMHDVCGNTYLSGFQAHNATPVSPGAHQTAPGSFWLGALGPGFSALLYATFYGPPGTHVDGGTSRFDPAGIIYHSACTNNPAFPVTSGAAFPALSNNSWDIASYKFNMDVGMVHADFILANNANDTGCAAYEVAFENLSTGATDYLWDFGDGTTSSQVAPVHTFGEGTYTVTLTASRSSGCNLSDTARMELYVQPTHRPLVALNDTFVCDPLPLTLHAVVSNLTADMSFRWEPAAAIMSNPASAQVTVNPAVSTMYTVYVDNHAEGMCVDSAAKTIQIYLFDYSNMAASPVDTAICPGDTVLLRAYGGTRYLWSPDERIEAIRQPFTQAWPDRTMAYKVLIESDSGCKVERGVSIRLLPAVQVEAGNDQDIKLGESTHLKGGAQGTFQWSPAGSVHPDNILHPEVAPKVTTTYYLTVWSPEGCPATDSVTIYVTNAFLPNAFSPNGDGLNDDFRLAVQDERVRLKDFSVYNRFGQRVFFTREIREGWDGTQDGRPADLGTYFYYVRYQIGVNTYTLKGDVSLIR